MPVSVRCSTSSSSRRRSTTSVSRISSYIRFHQIGEICDVFSPKNAKTTRRRRPAKELGALNVQRHLVSHTLRVLRDEAVQTWRTATAA